MANDNILDSEEKIRIKEEEAEDLEYAVPPTDIIAFNELRSCADIFRLYNTKQLDLNPDFQRGIVWPKKAQTLFIDSLIKQLPIPSLCISLDIKSQKRMVIDGLQRISTIVNFLNTKANWRLFHTDEVDSRISGKKVSEILAENPSLYEIVENVTIPITVLRCDYSKETHMKYLFQIFHRLNSGGSKLYNQEIRNCIYQGTFNTFLKNIVREPEWINFKGTTVDKISNSRFSHEEALLRFLAFFYDREDYEGKLAVFLNNYMFKNKDIEDPTIQKFSNIIKSTLNIINSNLPIPVSLGINATDGLLVGIATNLNYLNTLDKKTIKEKYDSFIVLPEFSQEELSEGLSMKVKVNNRLSAAIKVFSND